MWSLLLGRSAPGSARASRVAPERPRGRHRLVAAVRPSFTSASRKPSASSRRVRAEGRERRNLVDLDVPVRSRLRRQRQLLLRRRRRRQRGRRRDDGQLVGRRRWRRRYQLLRGLPPRRRRCHERRRRRPSGEERVRDRRRVGTGGGAAGPHETRSGHRPCVTDVLCSELSTSERLVSFGPLGRDFV